MTPILRNQEVVKAQLSIIWSIKVFMLELPGGWRQTKSALNQFKNILFFRMASKKKQLKFK